MKSIHPGDLLNQYRIENLVARSGMASIYKATDMQSNQAVAIKIPHPEIEGDPVLFERFQREAEIGQMLDHPGVMKVLAYNTRGQVYMVLEWVEGRLLRYIIHEEKKLPAERAIKLAVEILDALDYIHRNGVVHRDLKPENIMVNTEDHIKLIDFGIAGKTGARRLTFAKLSQVMGSPDYISPEQVKGKRGDARADLYAMGVILYEMVTGETPFSGPNPFAIMNDRVLNNPVPPREVNPEISAGAAGGFIQGAGEGAFEPVFDGERVCLGSGAFGSGGGGGAAGDAGVEEAEDIAGGERFVLRGDGVDSDCDFWVVVVGG